MANYEVTSYPVQPVEGDDQVEAVIHAGLVADAHWRLRTYQEMLFMRCRRRWRNVGLAPGARLGRLDGCVP